MAEIKIDAKATEYLKDKIGGGGSGGSDTLFHPFYKVMETFESLGLVNDSGVTTKLDVTKLKQMMLDKKVITSQSQPTDEDEDNKLEYLYLWFRIPVLNLESSDGGVNTPDNYRGLKFELNNSYDEGNYAVVSVVHESETDAELKTVSMSSQDIKYWVDILDEIGTVDLGDKLTTWDFELYIPKYAPIFVTIALSGSDSYGVFKNEALITLEEFASLITND